MALSEKQEKNEVMGIRGPQSSAPGGYGSITEKGYRRIYDSDQKRLRMEHDVVLEQNFGPILDGCYVHHKDENKLNNVISNLELVILLQHKRFHSGCVLIEGLWWKPCHKCRNLKPIAQYYARAVGVCAWCKSCCVRNAVYNKKLRRLKAKRWNYQRSRRREF